MKKTPNVLIIGAGIGGLAAALALRQAGCQVTVIEQAATLTEFGAGIQLAPNATRILRYLGLLDKVLEVASEPSGLVVRRYEDDTEIGPRFINQMTKKAFDAPMLVIHRADLQRILLEAVVDAKAVLRTSSRVQSIDSGFGAKVRLASGEWLQGDAVISADGIRSQVRAQMAQHWNIEDSIISTGDAAYRVTIPRSNLVECPKVLDSLDSGISTRWLGPGGHIMAYPLRGNVIFNVVMVHSYEKDDKDAPNIWTRRGNIDELHSFYGSWSPMVRQISREISSERLLQWPLNRRPHLPSWHINHTCLLGDAAHAMLPYVAQGAAQAIEDAAALMVCLTSLGSVAEAFSAYEALRKKRAEFIQDCAGDMRRVLHLPDGIEQERRDAAMRTPRDSGWRHPDLWADPSFQKLVWGYDAIAEASSYCASMKTRPCSKRF